MKRLFGLVALTLGCGPTSGAEHRIEPARTHASVTDTASDTGSVLEGAALIASYDTEALARLLATLPRPDPRGSPLVAAFSTLAGSFPPGTKLRALGLRPGSRIVLSLRALDERRAAVRKQVGDLAGLIPARIGRAELAELHEQSASLGAHIRIVVPSDDPEALEQLVARVAAAGPDDGWREVCAALAEPAACGGRPRMLAWTRPHSEGLRIDVLYLFHGPSDRPTHPWLVRAARRADVAGVVAPPPSDADLAIRIEGRASAALLYAELAADAALATIAGTHDEHATLARERAFGELLVSESVFTGLGIRGDVGDDGRTLEFELAWIPDPRVDMNWASLAEPSPLRLAHPGCPAALACMRLSGLSRLPRFAPLAIGAYADSTTIERVLDQAGERGWLLVEIATWPHLLGTLAGVATGEGLLARTAASLFEDLGAVGGAVLDLGPGAGEEAWIGWIVANPRLIDTLAPLATIAGIDFDTRRLSELPAVEARVASWTYEERRIELVTLVREHEGWVLAGDALERASWLMGLERAPSEEALLHIRLHQLGRLARREDIPYADDPTLEAWLQGRVFELHATIEAERGPIVTIHLGPE